MDYFDILLAKKLSGGGGGEITVEGLNVEENGTYTAPSGKAYSPVVVALPLDEKTITANGEYLASADDLKGFSKVTVNVAGFSKKAMPTGAISSFNDGTANPLTNLKIAINPVQAGSGDPSPSNPRPISGWTGANVTRCGKNLFDKDSKIVGMWDSGGSYVANVGYYTVYCRVNPNTTYYISGSTSWDNARMCYFNTLNPTTFTNRIAFQGDRQFTTGNDTMLISFSPSATTFPLAENLQVEENSTPTTYEPYNGTTYPISWQTEAGTVYAGTLDVTNGTLKARPYYASYNGEALIGPWISSLDEYEEGITPTTGAQVVDLGGTETTCQLTPAQVSSILGTNNIWSDTGDILEGEYFVAL